MANEAQKKRSIYHQRQRNGMQDLRFMMLLYLLGLLLYTALGYFLMSKLINPPEHFLRTYVFYSVGSFIVWCIPIRMLWNFNRLGRILFYVCAIASFYIAKDIPQFYAMGVEPSFYKYTFLILFIAKCITTFMCVVKLSFSYTIRSIWSMDDMFDDELKNLDVPTTAMVEQEPKTMMKWESKAKTLMRRTSIRLGICLYVSILFIFLVLTVLKVNVEVLSEGIGAIQYPLFSECLFSIMMWSVPIFGLYIGKKWSPYLIYVAVLAECIRIAISYQDIIHIFTNDIITMEVQILYIAIEVMRYFILFFACRQVLRSQLVKEYMHHGFNKTNQNQRKSNDV